MVFWAYSIGAAINLAAPRDLPVAAMNLAATRMVSHHFLHHFRGSAVPLLGFHHVMNSAPHLNLDFLRPSLVMFRPQYLLNHPLVINLTVIL